MRILFYSIFFYIIVSFVFLFSATQTAHASGIFGFSPSSLSFENVKAGNVIKQNIKITGGDDLSYTVIIEDNPMRAWLSVGETIAYSKIDFEIPLEIHIPKETKSALYESSIELLAESKSNTKGGANISANFSHIIPLKINVTNQNNINFNANWFEIPNAFAAQFWGPFHLKGGLQIVYELENKGNVAGASEKILYKIYEKKGGEKLLEFTSLQNESVEAFQTRRIIKSFPHALSVGTYFATAEFYRKGQFKPGKIFEKTFEVKQKKFSFFEKLKRIFL